MNMPVLTRLAVAVLACGYFTLAASQAAAPRDPDGSPAASPDAGLL